MFRSFRFSIALCCGVPLTLAFGVYLALLWRADDQRRRDLLIEQAKVEASKVVERFDLLGSEALEELPRRHAEPALAQLIQPSEAFVYVSILDRFGRVLAYSTDRGASVLEEQDKQRVYAITSPQYFEDLSEVYLPLPGDEENASGLIRLGVSEGYFQGAFSTFLLHGLPLGLLTLLLAVGLASLLAHRFLSRSLGPLINSVDRVSEGDFTRRVDTFVVRDELVPLSSSLNRLFETIESDKKHIHRLNSGHREFENRMVRFKSESVEQLHQLQQRDAELETGLRTLLRLTSQGVLIADPGGKVLTCNSQLRRMLRLERRGEDFYVPDPIWSLITRQFVASNAERAEGAFQSENGLLLTTRRYQFRVERLSRSRGQQQVMVVLEDSTCADQLAKEKADLHQLLGGTLWPVVRQLHEGLCTEGSGEPSVARREQSSSQMEYLYRLLEDWLYWDRKTCAGEPPPAEAVDPLELLESLPHETIQGFSKEVHLHLPERVEPLCGSREELQRLFRELLLLLQLAVPGRQDSAIDLIAEPDRLYLFLRKSTSLEEDWTAPAWLPRLAGDQPASQETWLNLKLSLVRLLADLYGAKLEAELQDQGGRQGVVISVELPVKQSRKTQDTTVDDLIKRFFVAPA